MNSTLLAELQSAVPPEFSCHAAPIASWIITFILITLYVMAMFWLYKRANRLCIPISDSEYPYKDRLTGLEKELKHLVIDDVHFEMTSQRLGHGSTGFVYKGFIYPKSSGRYRVKTAAAIKMSYPIPSMSLSLLEEAGRLSRLRHAHIVRLLAISHSSFSHLRPAVALEWLAGGSLEEYFKKHIRCHDYERERPVIFLKDVISILSQVASALRHMHSTMDTSGREMVHGDVASRNVLMMSSEIRGVTVKLGDFGVPDASGRRPVAWLPPEVLCANDGKVRHTTEADVWMFGVFAWECLTLGATPHYQRSIEEIQRCYRLPDRGLTCPHSCPLDVWSLVLECLAESHRRPRCAGREDVGHSLSGKLRPLLESSQSSSHRVFVVENVSNCSCQEHRCKTIENNR